MQHKLSCNACYLEPVSALCASVILFVPAPSATPSILPPCAHANPIVLVALGLGVFPIPIYHVVQRTQTCTTRVVTTWAKLNIILRP